MDAPSDFLIISTPIGEMMAISSEKGITQLLFSDTQDLAKTSNLIQKNNKHLLQLKDELEQYFEGKLNKFSVDLDLQGTEFQIKTWKEISKIPFGKTTSYAQLSKEKPKAIRAVAIANARNKILIIIPCHRVIGKDGSLTGYSGGLERKSFLLQLEGFRNETFGQMSLF